MPRDKILVLIMAGGAGSRMDTLTKVRAKPVLPFAGVYHLIDFPLSNCMHSGLTDVWVIEQFQPHNLNQHLANGRPWDLDRTYGGLRIIPPHTGASGSGFHQGNADAIYRNRRFIREFDPELILVLSADHIYKLDYQGAIDFHRKHNAGITIITTEVTLEAAHRFGTVEVDEQGRVTGFQYKPDEPKSSIVTTEVFVYSAAMLLDTLDELAAQGSADQDQEPALRDFGHELLPRLVEEGRAFAFPLQGYWRDVGVIEDYWQAHMDLLAQNQRLDLDDPVWPILTYGVQRMPARIHDGSRIRNSLIAPGCEIYGHVEQSVLGPGVVVEAGATVRNSIIFSDTRVEGRASVIRAIVDSDVVIGQGASVDEGTNGEITLIGQKAKIAANACIRAGEHVESDVTEQ